jgi:hypothetical protein
MKIFKSALVVFLIFGGLTLSSADDSKVGYPDNYRQWNHVKSMLIEPGHPLETPFQGLHHIYANDKALKGLQTGNYSIGSVIVFDLLQYNKKDKTISESDRKLVGVMYKDFDKFSKTGGWGFEGFAGDSRTKRLTNDEGKSCFSCHESQKQRDFVFSQLRK